MENVQKAAQLLQIPQELIFTNGRLASSTTYSIKQIKLNDLTNGYNNMVVTPTFSAVSTTAVAGVQPDPQSAPNSSAYAFNALSPMLGQGGFGYTYTGQTNGVHRLYVPHYEGIEDDPLSFNYGLYHWYNWQETLIEQTGPSEVTWTYRMEPGVNTYGYYDATPEHPSGRPTPPGDYSVLKIHVETTDHILTTNGLTIGPTYDEWVTIQYILDNSDWTVEDIIENQRIISVWDTAVDHDHFVTSIAVEVTQVHSVGASGTYDGYIYINGIPQGDIDFTALQMQTMYYHVYPGAFKRWIQYNKHYQDDVNPGAWYVIHTGNTWRNDDDCHIVLQYEDLNTIGWGSAPPQAPWTGALDYNTRIMKYSDDSYLIFEIEEYPGNSHNYGVGIKIDLNTGARYIW